MACEERQEQLVTLTKLTVHLGVEVVEVEVVVLEVVESFQEEVHVGTPGRHHHGRLLLQQRSFEESLGREQSDAAAAVPLVAVASAAGHVEHGCRGVAELCGNQAFVERGGSQRVVVEGGKQSCQMAHVVDRGIVVEHGVLRRCTATHLEAAGGVALHLHAGQQLQRAHDVVLAQQGGRILQFLQLYLLSANLGIRDAAFSRV